MNPISSSNEYKLPWTQPAIQVLQENNVRLDQALPSNKIQTYVDSFYENRLVPLLQHKKAQALNAWLESNGHGNWFQQLGSYLAKLTLRSVRDILAMVYSVLKAVVYGAVHPLKALNKAAEFFIRFIEALQHAETYSTLGAGALGAAFGQGVVAGFHPPLLAVGTLLLTAGVGYEAIRAAAKAPQGARLRAAKSALKVAHLPQALMTGLLTGLIAGCTQRIFAVRAPTRAEADCYLKQWMAKHHYSSRYIYGKDYKPDIQTFYLTWVKRPRCSWMSKGELPIAVKVPSVQLHHPASYAVASQAVTAATLLAK